MTPQEVYKKQQELVDEIKQIQKEIRDLEDLCEHDFQYEGDPAGGSDSGYYCFACGKRRKRT